MARVVVSRYPPEQAVADVVQRCVEAGASQVDVAVEFAGAASFIRIAADVAAHALAPPDGAATGSNAAGLDVVSACLAMGREVDVSGARAVVLVEGLHDVLACKRREGRVIESVVARLHDRVRDTLGLAFHRPLVRQGRRALALTLNAEPVVPRDPLPPSCDLVRPRRHQLPLVVEGRVETVLATTHLLAPLEGDPAQARHGFFVYLRDRLVQAGGWSRLSVAAGAGAVARVAVDIPDSAGEAFHWEAAARRVLFPATLVPALRALAFEAVTAALPQLPTVAG